MTGELGATEKGACAEALYPPMWYISTLRRVRSSSVMEERSSSPGLRKHPMPRVTIGCPPVLTGFCGHG